MNITKRQFLKLSVGSSIACVLAPLLKTVSLFAGPLVMPPGYLDSAVHSYWMRLSHNNRFESRQVRRIVGTALRNIGAIRGNHRGFNFTLAFDKAVNAAFSQWVITRQKPASVFGLIQMLYDDFLQPELGIEGGRALFGVLLGMLRCQDGTAAGDEAHQAYLDYRNKAILYKDWRRTVPLPMPEEKEQLRQNRIAALNSWQTKFLAQVDSYASGATQLNEEFAVTIEMLKGFHTYVDASYLVTPTLKITKRGDQAVVDYRGEGKLEEAASLDGPWVKTRKSSPAAFDVVPAKFFRTRKETGIP